MRPISPLRLRGTVVHGHGRGGTQLGFPTANLDDATVEKVQLTDGVYCGYAAVDDAESHPMVMSVGWNPHFKDRKRSVEVHILHKYGKDFYGSTIDVDVRAWMRQQESYPSLEALIKAIEDDCTNAKEFLAKAGGAKL